MVTVVIGGQYGSESKGKVAVHLAEKLGCAGAVRTGGMNAGHTIWVGKNQSFKFVCRQLPSPVAVPGVPVMIGAGGMVDINLLTREISELESFGVEVKSRLTIDPYAVIARDDAGLQEKEELGLGTRLGSTQTGTGFTQSERVLRRAACVKDSGLLKPFIGDVTQAINVAADRGGHVIIEGTQGFGLSNYHGGCYPFCTSRDTSASGFASEAGISPRLVSDIWMVVRTFPIRVGGNSGPMWNEVSWKDIQEYSGCPEPLIEMTSVTKKVRRVGLFDWEQLKRAVMVNRPTRLAVHGLDYLDYTEKGHRQPHEIRERAATFLKQLEEAAGVPVGMAFTGPHQRDLIDLDEATVNWRVMAAPAGNHVPDGEGDEL